MGLENAYQPKLIEKLRRMFPGIVIQKLDTGYQQGIPDLLLLYGPRWAILEVKREDPSVPGSRARYEVNQEYFIHQFNDMSFSACIYPENEEDVLSGLQQAFSTQG